MKELRSYQVDIADGAVKTLRSKMIVYLAMQVRTGKTATSLEVARLYGATSVLFLTKKKVIENIEDDYKQFGFDMHFLLTVANDESLHKVVGKFDIVIHDEHHRFGAFPKTGKATRLFKQRFGKLPQVYLSGTPTPESYSQIFHQFWVSDYSPFTGNFYQWAKEWVTVKKVRIGHTEINDYSNCDPKVMDKIKDYMIYYTQGQAGFVCQINEQVIQVPTPERLAVMMKQLRKDRVIKGKSDVILADTPAKLMSKIHQMSSGTVILESGNAIVLSDFKARFTRERWKDKKVVIFYKFAAELTALQDVWGDDLTTSFEVWNEWLYDGALAVQMLSGREGMNYSRADLIIFFNIDFSALTYWQGRDRMTSMERKEADVVFLTTSGGIEKAVLDAVKDKKNYTLSHFRNETPKESNRQMEKGRLFCD